MERTEIKPISPADNEGFMGTNLNEDSWVPFNDKEEIETETRLPPRPEPTVGVVSPDQHQEEMMRQQQEMMRQQQYMNMMQPPAPQEHGVMASIKETPVTTIAVIFAIGLALGFIFNNRRPIILNGH